MKRVWQCIDDIGDKWLYKGSVAPVKYEDIWNNSDEEPEDYQWIPETEIEDVYVIDFMKSLPNIDDGEMVEIRIKCTAEKCEQEQHLIYMEYFQKQNPVSYSSYVEI